MISSMQPPNNPGAQYPTWRYHWTKDPLVVHNAGEESALGGGWGDTPGSFAPYQGPRPARTDRQNATQWVDDWPVHGVTPEHRRAIKIELLRADARLFRRGPKRPIEDHFQRRGLAVFHGSIHQESMTIAGRLDLRTRRDRKKSARSARLKCGTGGHRRRHYLPVLGEVEKFFP